MESVNSEPRIIRMGEETISGKERILYMQSQFYRSVFCSDKFFYETLILCESQFLPLANSPVPKQAPAPV